MKAVFTTVYMIFTIVFVITFYLSIPLTLPSSVIQIPKGSTKSIVSYLAKNGVDIFSVDRYMLDSLGNIQAGWIDFGSKHLTRGDFFYKLTHEKAATQEISLIPGDSTYITFQHIANKTHLSFDKLYKTYINNAPMWDGWLVPETYKIPKGIAEEALVKILLDHADKYQETLMQESIQNVDTNKWKKILTISSLIEKEAVLKKEMPLISAVIYNRLKKGMKLQMDGSLNYAQNSHKKVDANTIKNDRSEFNTYRLAGLPNAPIALVSKGAIQAALNPADVDYLYFVSKDGEKHLFSKTYEEHLKNIQSND